MIIPTKKMVPVKAKTPAFCHNEEAGCADVSMQSGSEKLDFLRILVQKNLIFLIIQFRKTEHLMTT